MGIRDGPGRDQERVHTFFNSDHAIFEDAGVMMRLLGQGSRG
ncbi:MAG: hypothetical protein PHX88_03665 [Methanoculleus horonobensis]|nr:hypothetical protein [Methanoculleus horonobensis]MDD4251907.1 hypothetical protein [Methanoculleus horonobensis]